MWLGENFVEAICNISSMLIMYQKNTQTQVSLHQVSLLFMILLCMIGSREFHIEFIISIDVKWVYGINVLVISLIIKT